MNLQEEQSIQSPNKPTLKSQPSRATLLRQLLVITAVALGLVTFLFFIRGDLSGGNFVLGGVTLLVLLLGAGLLRAKQVTWAAHLYTAAFWLAITAILIIYEIIRVPSPGVYFIVVLGVALLLGSRVTFLYAVLSFVTAALIIFATELGRLPLYQPSTDYVPSINNNYPKALITLSLLGLAYYVLRHTLATLHFNEIDLLQIRQTLGQRTADLSDNEQPAAPRN